MNGITSLAILVPAGVLVVATDTETWWHAPILALGVLAAMLASTWWPERGISRLALPCLIVTAAVWVFGVLVADSGSAFFGIICVGPFIVPKLPRHRVAGGLGLTAFVGAVGAARLLVPHEDVGGVLIQFVLIPAGVTAIVTGLMFANQAFYDLFAELEESREREAELAVVRERIRFASDLHDIQGHTLHVVKLKIALAQKLLHRDIEKVEEELREVHALVADTITQTKELAYAQRRLNLPVELENAKNLFEAAGIRVHVDREAPEVESHAGELLGQVLRETTTNILRHAQATQVRITLSESGIVIVNDGAQQGPLPKLSGLSTLRERVAGDGAELTVTQKDGQFRTAAAFPRTHSDAVLTEGRDR